MNEPKKRGRPSKAEVAARAASNAQVEGGDAVQPSISTDAVVEGGLAGERAPTLPEGWVEAIHCPLGAEVSPAQGYAMRVWYGQSPSEDRAWRISRVREALEGQGLSMEGVELPNG